MQLQTGTSEIRLLSKRCAGWPCSFVDTEDGFVRVDDQKQVCVRSVGQQMRPRIVPTDLLHEPRQQHRQLIAQFLLLRQPQQQNNDPIVELILEA